MFVKKFIGRKVSKFEVSNKFSVGDIVICTDKRDLYPTNEIGKILCFHHDNNKDICVEYFEHIGEHGHDGDGTGKDGYCYWAFSGKGIKKALINNSLNKKLYPSYKVWQDYLVPAKVADKLKEQE